MRIRIGAAMPLHGGRPAVVVSELKEETLPDGTRVIHTDIGHVARIIPFSVEATSACVADLAKKLIDHRPCVVVDTGSAQGLALYLDLRKQLPADIHRPHSFPGTGKRNLLFTTFLQTYADDRLSFKPGLPYRVDLDRSLVFFGGSGAAKDGFELSSEDEALVLATGLSMQYAKHGATARTVKRK